MLLWALEDLNLYDLHASNLIQALCQSNNQEDKFLISTPFNEP